MSGTHNKGKKRGSQHCWTYLEDQILCERAGKEIAAKIAADLGVTKIQVQVRCDRLGIEWRVKGGMKKAAKDGAKFFSSPLPCKRGHTALRRVSNGCCLECEKLTDGAQYKNHYKSRKREARPKNLTIEQKREIWSIYRECRKLSRETGIPHEVDHIVPLAKGGKHVASNLQILTADQNRRKSCRLDFVEVA